MKHVIVRSVLTLLLCATFATVGFAGAWTAPKNGFYEKLSYNYYYAHENFDSTGSRVETPNNGRFSDNNVTNYLEYGVTDDLTLINSLSYKWLKSEDDFTIRRGHGLGDVDLGARYKLHESAAGVVSSQLLVKIPGTYSKNDPLPLGNDQVDVELRLLYGRSLYPLIPAYGNLELGYRWRDQDPSDEIRYLVEFGVDITKSLYARAKLDGIFSVDNGKRTDFNGNPTATNNFDLGKIDLTVGYQVTPMLGVELSYVPAVYGQNTAAGATYAVAVYLKRQ